MVFSGVMMAAAVSLFCAHFVTPVMSFSFAQVVVCYCDAFLCYQLFCVTGSFHVTGCLLYINSCFSVT